MRTTVPGSARTVLLAALALAAAAMVTAIAVMATRSDSTVDPAARPDEATTPLGSGRADPAGRRRPIDPGEEGETDDGDEWEPRGQPGGSRDPEGPVFVVTADTLRAEFAVRHWEEVRRMIDVLQAEGGTVPSDVVKQLIEMLAKDDLRLDAVLALGGVKDDLTGRLLGELALSNDATIETRQAALDALAKSGQKSVLPLLQQLIGSENLDERIARHAFAAVAGVGGPEATGTLLDLLSRHLGDDLRGAIVVALGRARDADTGMAETVRTARERGDKELLQAALMAATIQGAGVGPELEAELLKTVEGTSSLSAFADETDRQIIQGSAMPAAVAAGIVEPILRAATTSGPLRDIALNALRQARGDDAARAIAAALSRSTDETERRELTVALGETGSRAATSMLVSLLGDESGNVRRGAARGLGQIRDTAAVKPILAHLGKAAPDHDFANGLIVALGIIGAHEAITPLEKLAASKEEFWRQLRPFIQNAIVRIQTGNPDSLRLDPKPRAK